MIAFGYRKSRNVGTSCIRNSFFPNPIVKVIQMCYSDSKKYNLDFSNVSLEKNAADTANDTGGIDEFGASRRGPTTSGAGAANKKTRVSFILSGGY